MNAVLVIGLREIEKEKQRNKKQTKLGSYVVATLSKLVISKE